jgi:hypothetical protein
MGLEDSLMEGKAATRKGSMHWISAALVFFAFAAPSAVVGVGNSLATQGLLLGSAVAFVVTLSSAAGSYLLLSLWLDAAVLAARAHPARPPPRSLGDIGRYAGGIASSSSSSSSSSSNSSRSSRSSSSWLEQMGNAIQFANFFLYMPVAFDLVAECARALAVSAGVGVSLSDGAGGCTTYYTMAVSLLCLATTQVRSLGNTTPISCFCAVAVLVTMAVQIALVAAHGYEGVSVPYEPALLAGNPDPLASRRWTRGLLGATAACWSFVPAFLLPELACVAAEPAALGKSLLLSAASSLLMFLATGLAVAVSWGWQVENPVTISPAWQGAVADSAGAQLLNALLFAANLCAYCLDTVPLARACQRRWLPAFRQDEWSPRACAQFLACSLPTWLAALLLSALLPDLFAMLAFATALTVPLATMVFPALCYLAACPPPHLGGAPAAMPVLRGEGGGEEEGGKGAGAAQLPGGRREKRAVALWCLGFGALCVLVCWAAAIGNVADATLRGPTQIGCKSWGLL